jgi:hypothetical protein
MKKIRTSTFETNSSSVHTIIISKRRIEIPGPCEIVYWDRDFSGEIDEYWDWKDKAIYFHIACTLCSEDREDNKRELTEKYDKFLEKYRIKITCKDNVDHHGFSWIDHPEEIAYFAEKLVDNPDILEGFIFGKYSRIYTSMDGNDSKAVEIGDRICGNNTSCCGSQGLVRIGMKKPEIYAYVKGN